MRTCTKCGVSHPVEFFNKDRTRDDGLYPQCKNCSRRACRTVYGKYHDKHLALKQRWKDENRERHREINRLYRNANSERGRAATARYRARLVRATPAWLDLKLVKAVYDRRPDGCHVDHIIPLNGPNVSGLNVPWNLQYLPAEVHWRKGNKVPEYADGGYYL